MLSAAQDKERMLRTVAIGLRNVIHDRIHTKGLDANLQPIGTYSKGYMKVRTGQFENATRFKKGKNAGKNKDSGVFTKRRINTPFGKSKFAIQNIEEDKVARPNFNRTGDTKKIVSLTRATENDFKVLASRNGYGLGYSNPFNLQKMRWQEEREKKKIASMAPEERTLAITIAKEYIGGLPK